MLITLLALATQGAVTLPSPPLRYRIDTRTNIDQDNTAIGKGKASGSLTSTAFVSVALTDSADGQVARITVDSMTLEPAGAMTAKLSVATATAAADSARGLWVHTYSVRGAIRIAPRPSSPNPALATVIQAVAVMFPGLRSNIKVGDKWADTTKIDNDIQVGHQNGSIVASWSVTGRENGGFILDGTSATTVTTTGQNGQSLTVNGTSREHLVMAADGPSHGALIESTSDARTVQQAGTAPTLSKTTGLLRLTQIP